jgi:hypothetical protein
MRRREARVCESRTYPSGCSPAWSIITSTGVSRLHRDFAAGPLKLLDRNQTFRLVAKIDDHVFGGDAKDRSLQHFIRGRGREMAVVVEKILVAVRDFLVRLLIVRVYGHYASASHCLTVNCQVLERLRLAQHTWEQARFINPGRSNE